MHSFMAAFDQKIFIRRFFMLLNQSFTQEFVAYSFTVTFFSCRLLSPSFSPVLSYLEQYSFNFHYFLSMCSTSNISSGSNCASDSSKAARTVGISRRFYLLFLSFSSSTSFEVPSAEPHLKILFFLRWLLPCTMPAAVKIRQMAAKKFQFRSAGVCFVSVFGARETATLRKLGTQQH